MTLSFMIIKLNKYLIRIIDSYNTINVDELISYIPKTQIKNILILRENYTITDLIIKSINCGYKGFWIDQIDQCSCEAFESQLLKNYISKFVKGNINCYSFEKDKRIITPNYIAINELDIFKTKIIEKSMD